jgi:hypothetical protein
MGPQAKTERRWVNKERNAKGDNSVEKEVIEGYGPPDLVERVRKAAWTACVPSGKNFQGIVLGDYVLTDTPDEFCPVKFRVTLETVPRGDRFTVDGYHCRYLLDSIRKRSRPTTFAGCCLSDAPIDDAKAYRATVEIIS